MALFSLDNQVVVVTGAAKGIGKGIATVMRKAGATLVIGDMDKEAGEKTAKELGGEFIELDVTNEKSVDAFYDELIKRHGRIDVLCSNVGIFPQALIEDMTEKDWDLMNNVNLKGMFFMVKRALKLMREKKYGRVVITSSITGPVTGYPGWAHYGATKAAQMGFMRSAALEYAKDGITINAVQPGNIKTEGLIAQGEEYMRQMTNTIPTHELGAPEDIGYAALFFASREAAYVTGQSIIVDGGQILPESPDAIL